METAYAENRELHQLCYSFLMIANQWEGEKYSVKSDPRFRNLAGVFQGTSMDRCGKLLAHVPSKQQILIREWGWPGEVKVIREVSSKNLWNLSVLCQPYSNRECLLFKIWSRGGGEAQEVMAECEVMFMAAVQGDSKSSFTAPATCWDCQGHILQSTVWYQLALFACICLRKTVMG